MWEHKLITVVGGKFSINTIQFKTKKEAVKAFPSKMARIERHGRTYYITVSTGK